MAVDQQRSGHRGQGARLVAVIRQRDSTDPAARRPFPGRDAGGKRRGFAGFDGRRLRGGRALGRHHDWFAGRHDRGARGDDRRARAGSRARGRRRHLSCGRRAG